MSKITWKNWSGSVECHPSEILFPVSENEIIDLIQKANEQDRKLRIVGTGHSFSHLVYTNDLLISLDKLQGIIDIDTEKAEASVWAGTKIKQLGESLFEKGLAQENLGDVDVQSIAGSIMTGTHGTGLEFGNLATQVISLTMVTGTGELVTVSENEQPDLFKAALISLGTLGIVTRYRLRLKPAYKLEMVVKKALLDDTITRISEYTGQNRNFEIFSFLYSDKVQLRMTNETDKPVKKDGFGRYINEILLENYLFWAISETTWLFPQWSARASKLSAAAISELTKINHSHRIYATKRMVRFNEMEYNIPLEHYPKVVKAIYRLNKEQNFQVHFPLEHRFVKADDIWLSPAYGRQSAYVAIHVYRGKPYKRYFTEMEALFRDFGGRPHWGKMHFLDHHDLAKSYPKWESFLNIRARLDPKGIFLNDYLKRIFGLR